MPPPARLKSIFAGLEHPVASLAVQAERSSARVAGERKPFRILVAHLFACFFASDLPASSSTQPTTLTLQIAAALGIPPVMFVFSLVPSYSGTEPWMTLRAYWLQAQDHFILITYACVVAGIAAISKWDRFFPTLLDVRVLTPLPISKARLFAAKVLAVAMFLGAFLVGANLPASLLLVGIAGSQHAARQLLAHLVAVGLAGCFTAASSLAVVSLAGLLPAAIRRPVCSFLQGGLLAVLLLLLFSSPWIGASTHLLLSAKPSVLLWLPPYWFVGIYEVVWNAAPESHMFIHLAEMGVLGTIASTALLFVAYPLAYRRKAEALLEGEEASKSGVHLLSLLHPAPLQRYLPSPLQAASFHFLGQTLFRIQRFRVSLVLAGCSGLALAATLFATFRITYTYPFLAAVHLRPVTMVVALLFFVIGSLYVSFSTDLDPKATWIFVSIVGQFEQQIASGLRRWVILLACSFAVVSLLLLWFLTPNPHRVFTYFARDLLTLVGMCFVTTEFFFHAFRDIPFTTDRLRRQGMAATVLICIFAVMPLSLVALEHIEDFLTRSWFAVALWTCVAGVTCGLLKRRRSRGEFQDYVESEDGPFQRLGL